jgi:nucleoside 2-deoxyribosyltransferase
MEIVYWLEKFPELCQRSIFLAGPTAGKGKPSWRTETIELLRQHGFDGHIFIPEPRGVNWPTEDQHDTIVDWEVDGLNRADCILFWVPRDLKTLPGLTTNIEYGEWFKSGKVVLGSPDDAVKMAYMRYRGSLYGVPQSNSLEQTVALAIQKVGAVYVAREGGECTVPLYVWHTKAFQLWRLQILDSGYVLERARIAWVDYDQGMVRNFVALATIVKKATGCGTEEITIFGRADGTYEVHHDNYRINTDR